jgi:hypothetical protein
MDDGSVAGGSSTSAGKDFHRVSGGPRLQAGVDGIRFYTVACDCGWESEPCRSAVLAEADGEQHLTLSSGGRRARGRGMPQGRG